MKTSKILKNTLAIGVAVAGLISLASCDLFGTGDGPVVDNDHTHAPEFVSGMDATCTKNGFEDHYKCDCGKLFADAEGTIEISAPVEIEAKGHVEVVIPAKPSSCTQDGTTEGKKCSVCNIVLKAGDTVPHTGVIIDGEHYCYDILGALQADGLTLLYDNESGEYTLFGENGTISSIIANGVIVNIKGNVTIAAAEGNAVYSSAEGKVVFSGCTATVNGDIVSDTGYIVVNDGATLNLNGKIRVNGAAVANAESEYGYDYRFYVPHGTVNASCDIEDGAVIIADSMAIGSVENNTKGNFNISNLLPKGNGFDNDGAFRWVFANGDINVVGCEDKTGTAICMGKSGTGYVDIMKGIKIHSENEDYCFGEWYKGSKRYIGIEEGATMTSENTNHLFHVQGNDILYAHTYVEMEYTLGDVTGLAVVRITNADDAVISAKGNFESLDFITYPSAEEYDEVTFISWVE